MTEVRIIKKYPNRRLYDTVLSRYITLDDVKILVQDRIPIQIIEARTKKDITHINLLYIIVEQETSHPPLLNSAVLEYMIRLHSESYLTTHVNAKAIYQLVIDTFSYTVSFLAEQLNLLTLQDQLPEHVTQLIESSWKRGLLNATKKKMVAKIS